MLVSKYISYKAHVIGEEFGNRFQDSIGEHNDLLAMMKMLYLRWYGHIAGLSCMSDNSIENSKRSKDNRRAGYRLDIRPRQ